ncbi:MAG: hypothetical protein JRG96_00700 [Deltaproteobacteria bacterium]|nr:hypothetical protein [Deltaproteobacteria bacterium]MBW2417202.1 hypothetical protein [Deltaproteobacteria bacterium]
MENAHPDAAPWQQRNRTLLEQADGIELSLVELVLAASECSEDEGEVCDLVDVMLETGKVVLSEVRARDEPGHAVA